MAKTFAKMTIGITALAVTTWFGTSSSRAYGDAPWCAVINLGKHVYRDCQYRTFEMLWGIRRERCILGAGHESKERCHGKSERSQPISRGV